VIPAAGVADRRMCSSRPCRAVPITIGSRCQRFASGLMNGPENCGPENTRRSHSSTGSTAIATGDDATAPANLELRSLKGSSTMLWLRHAKGVRCNSDLSLIRLNGALE
jgi:hypothetical protein